MNSPGEKLPAPQNPERKIIGFLKGGALVVDRFNSHITDRSTEKLVSEALQHIDPAGRDYVVAEVDLERRIGETVCVVTNENDEIVYARRPNRAGPTRFVKNRERAPSSFITAVLRKDETAVKEQYILLTGYIGPNAGPEPWDPQATEASRSFWSTHALVWESVPVISGTEQTEVPPEFQ